MIQSLLIGRRAVYTKVNSKYDDTERKMVELSRETFRGVIAALVTTSSSSYAAVVMLYDDGSLRTHSIDTITVEGEAAEGPYR